MSTPLGPAVLRKIAENLREFGYSDVTAEIVKTQLQKPEDERDIIGMFATSMLRDNGITEFHIA